jgi:hypothetical protein
MSLTLYKDANTHSTHKTKVKKQNSDFYGTLIRGQGIKNSESKSCDSISGMSDSGFLLFTNILDVYKYAILFFHNTFISSYIENHKESVGQESFSHGCIMSSNTMQPRVPHVGDMVAPGWWGSRRRRGPGSQDVCD